jgi:hypothetical protein
MRLSLTKYKNIFLVALAIIFSLYTYRSALSGKLLGEPFDARLMISLHEHMFRWLNGLVSFRDTEFFYPYKTALGFSDVFLVQGLVYSIFRFLGIDSLSSWMNVTIILAIIGNLGWVVLAKIYLKHFYVQILFVLTIISSLSFVHYFTFNANVVGYTYLSWMMIFFMSLASEKKARNFHIKLNLFIVTFLVYALSCWYGAFFFILTIIIWIIIKGLKYGFKPNFKFERSMFKIHLVFAPLIAFFVWLFYFVYISVSDQPGRPVAEMLTNSPRIQQILSGANPNGGGMEGALFGGLYEWLDLDNPIIYNNFLGDWGGGLGIFLPLLLIIVILVNFFIFKIIKDFSLMLAVLISYLYFTVFGNNLSLHSYLFNVIPGLNSIRSPSRYIIFVGFAGIFLLFYYFDRLLSMSRKNITKVLIALPLLFVFFDQQRSSFKGWDRENFINSELIALTSKIQSNCDYFYYDKPGGWWYDQIEALTFAVQIGVPTVNGYSGAFPPNYPNMSWNRDAPSLEIFNWMKQIDENEKGCLVLGNSNVRYLSDLTSSIDFYGFTEEESIGSSKWRWAVSNQAHLLIIGKENSRQEFEFDLRGAPCFESQTIEVVVAKSAEASKYTINKDSSRKKIILDFKDSIAQSISFNVNSSPCVLDGDPRDLYFEVKNIQLTEI